MTSLSKWIKGLEENMTSLYKTTYKTTCGDYDVTPRSYERIRRLHYKATCLIPYMDEQRTAFKVAIKPTPNVINEESIPYSWSIRREEQDGRKSEHTYGSGSGVVSVTLNKSQNVDILTDLIVYSGKYGIYFTLNNEEKRIGILTLKDRTDMYKDFMLFAIPIAVSLALSIIALINSAIR